MQSDRFYTLNNHTKMPRVGLGVYQMDEGPRTEQVVSWALDAGYRHFDTAKLYGNEASVGRAVLKSTVPREDIWVTSKLWPTDALDIEKAFETSLVKSGLDYLDLYLVHFPVPGALKQIWKKMEAVHATGKAKAIGVSNYSAGQLQTTLNMATVPPSVNQVKASVFSYDKVTYELCRKEGIAYEAYSPLTRGKQLDNAEVGKIATLYGKTPAQIMLKWALQKDMIVIPKTQNMARLAENIDLYDFTISSEHMESLDSLSN